MTRTLAPEAQQLDLPLDGSGDRGRRPCLDQCGERAVESLVSLVDVGSGATRQRSNHAQGEREDDERTPGGNLPMVIVIGDPGLSRCTRETNALAAEIVQLRRSYGPASAELTARQTCRHSTDQSFHVFAPGHFGVRADQRAGPGCVDGPGGDNDIA